MSKILPMGKPRALLDGLALRMAAHLWGRGYDTKEIAGRLSVKEQAVYNSLAQMREARRAEAKNHEGE